MLSGVLITHNSTHHPPETWAVTTAGQIVSVDNDTAPEKKIPGLALQAKIAEALQPFYQKVMDAEHAAIQASKARVHAGYEDVHNFIDEGMQAVKQAATGSPFEQELMAKAEQIREVLGSHIATIMHIHRQSFGQPDFPEGQ